MYICYRVWHANGPLLCLAVPKTRHALLQNLASEFNDGPRGE